MSCAVQSLDTEKEKYTSLYIKWNDLNNENNKLKEQMEARQKELAKERKLMASLLDKIDAVYTKENNKLTEEVKELKEENKKLKEEHGEKEKEVSLINYEEMENEEKIAELETYNIFLKAECCAGGWAGRDNDIHQFADDVKGYFQEYKETHKIENVEELYKEWASDGWACIEDYD